MPDDGTVKCPAHPNQFTSTEKKMKIAMLAFESDTHAAALKWALESVGYSVACWAGLSWMEDRQATLSFEQGTRVVLGRHTIEPGDVVWIRRPNPPMHNPGVTEADKDFAQTEYKWHSNSVLYLLEHLPVRCINPYSASRTINNKAVQLHLASLCGLNTPASLLTNSPSAVREFLNHSSRRAICKAYFPHVWKKEGSEAVSVTETFEINTQDLPDDEVLTYAPAIYQEMVVKDADVRTVLMGTTLYSFLLRTTINALDWRQEVGQGKATLEPVPTPPQVETAVLAFAQKAGIEFGSLDFAVDRDGNWWFLEINEEGQFLWLDGFDSGARIQEKFLAFLTLPKGSTREAIEAAQSAFPSWQQFLESPEADIVYSPEENLTAPVLSVEP
jgi:glutathione synthase/RimK-type ligase-like ATP-grasp enzyme